MSPSKTLSIQADREGIEPSELLQRPYSVTSSSSNESSFNWQAKTQKGTATNATALFRSVGLQIINILGPWKAGKERRKVAVRQDRGTALVRCAVHFVPLIACIIMFVLNFCTALISNYNSGYATLQFVAKVHEVLMQASIAAILLSYIRSEAIEEGRTPFGSLFAGVQVSQIAYLWSPELVGTVTATYLTRWRKIKLASTIILSILLAALVGPSSAILMLPRSISVQLGQAALSITPEAQDNLFPTQLTPSNNGTSDLLAIAQFMSVPPLLTDTPPTGGPSLQGAVTSGYFGLSSRYSFPRKLNIKQDSISYGGDDDPHWLMSTASVPLYACSAALTDLLMDRLSHGGIHADSHMFNNTGQVAAYLECKQPYVQANCSESTLYAPDDFDSTLENSTLLSFKNSTGGFTISTKVGQIVQSYNNSIDPRILWLPTPKQYQKDYSILAVVLSRWVNKKALNISTCTVKASWLASSANVSRITNIAGYSTDPRLPEEPFRWPSIVAIDPAWAETASLGDPTSALYGGLPRVLDSIILSEVDPESPTSAGSFFVNAEDSIVAGIIATGMSTSTSEWTQTVTSKDWGPKRDRETQPGPSSGTNLHIDLYELGMGYAVQSIPVILATCILLIYCAFALSFIIFSISSGISSSSWDSAAEITVLALNSSIPSNIEHTSAGIETVTIFQEPVSILANGKESLEIVFRGNAEELRSYRKIGRNEAF